MEITLDKTVQIIAIIGFAAAVMRWGLVNPLQTSIDSLKEAISEMKKTLSQFGDEQKCIDKRLVAVEESAKSAHKRIDRIDGIEVHAHE